MADELFLFFFFPSPLLNCWLMLLCRQWLLLLLLLHGNICQRRIHSGEHLSALVLVFRDRPGSACVCVCGGQSLSASGPFANQARHGTATEIISDDNDLTASCLDGNKLHSTVNSRRWDFFVNVKSLRKRENGVYCSYSDGVFVF